MPAGGAEGGEGGGVFDADPGGDGAGVGVEMEVMAGAVVEEEGGEVAAAVGGGEVDGDFGFAKVVVFETDVAGGGAGVFGDV